jgi:hypothetical protein
MIKNINLMFFKINIFLKCTKRMFESVIAVAF